MTYTVYGDYGYTSEEILHESDSLSEAIRWAKAYTRFGDMGGYGVIEVAEFADSGEYVTHLAIHADDDY